MRLIFAGTPEVALPALEAVVASEHDVVAVLTRPDAPRGRGRTLHPSPVGARAAELGIETIKADRPGTPEVLARLRELEPDCCPVVAYGALLPQRVLDVPVHGWVNLHFSLLPRWRGAAPVQHAVLAGDAETGACVFRLVKAMDAGPVFDRITTPIGPTTTSGALLEQLAVDGAPLLVRTLDSIAAGTGTAVDQPADGITLAPKIEVGDAELDLTRSAVEVDRRIRACTPAPGAWTTFRGERFKIISAAVADGSAAPGSLLVERRSLRVGTGDGVLELIMVQPPGKKAMPAADWARGVQFADDERLG